MKKATIAANRNPVHSAFPATPRDCLTQRPLHLNRQTSMWWMETWGRKVRACGCSKIDESRKSMPSLSRRTIPHGTLAIAGCVLLLALPRHHPCLQSQFAAGTRCRSNFQGAVASLLVSLSLGGSAVGPPPGAIFDSGLTYCLASKIPTPTPPPHQTSSHIHMMI
jgi:hypothetical protein